MALSDTTIRTARPRERPYKLYDDGGLFVLVTPPGGKLWRFKYRFLGKEKLLALGAYPAIGLSEARRKRDSARKIVAESGDPAFEKKKESVAAKVRAINTFAAVAEEFIAKREREGLAEITTRKMRWLSGLLEPSLGKRPIAEIEPFELLHALRKIEKAGPS